MPTHLGWLQSSTAPRIHMNPTGFIGAGYVRKKTIIGSCARTTHPKSSALRCNRITSAIFSKDRALIKLFTRIQSSWANNTFSSSTNPLHTLTNQGLYIEGQGIKVFNPFPKLTQCILDNNIIKIRKNHIIPVISNATQSDIQHGDNLIP